MRVAITGGSGSLGRALITRLAADGADRIVTFSRDEQKRHKLAHDFAWHPGVRVYAGDVRDPERMRDLFSGCEVVIHAAARKVVTSHPDEPAEMLKTNVLGTQHVIDAARLAGGVTKLLVISSDKAVRAENVYGVSKAYAEHLAINANARTLASGLRVGVLRYGNVLGSTGSVLKIWAARADAGLPLQLSDKRMTRFWITMPQAVDAVLAAVANLRGGEICVPHLPAAPVARLLEAVAGADARVEETGIRPGGEKLYEELLSADEVRRTVRRGPLYIVPPTQHAEMWDASPWLGKRVEPDMAYRSDTWPWQLSVTEIRNMVAAMEVPA